MRSFFIRPVLLSNRVVNPIQVFARNLAEAMHLARNHWPCALNFIEVQ